MSAVESLIHVPYAADAEQAVLGALMLDPKAMALIADWLGVDDFFAQKHRIIFRAIAETIESGRPCDAVTMGDWFDDNGLAEEVGGAGYIIQLANQTPGSANIVAYAEIVAEKAKLRALASEGADLHRGAISPGANSTDLVAKSMHALSAMSAARARGGLTPVKPAMKLLYAEICERYQSGPGLLGLPTPWAELNRITKGLRNGAVYIVGGRPSMGKSIIGGMLAAFTALRGERTALFSVEMTTQECLARAAAAHGNIPFDWVEQPSDAALDAELYWPRLTQIMGDLIAAPLLIDDTPSLRIEQLKARARREHMRDPLKLIVVDHIHDMGTASGAELRNEYGRIVQGGKDLAKELNIPVVMLAQLNRAAAQRSDKRPTMTDLRESGEIEQKADVIVFVHREDYYDKETHLRGIAELIPAKGRNIRIGETVYVRNNTEFMRMEDMDGPVPLPPPAAEKARGRGMPDYRSQP